MKVQRHAGIIATATIAAEQPTTTTLRGSTPVSPHHLPS